MALLWTLALPRTALADGILALAADLPGLSLGRSVDVLEDETGRLGFEQVSSPGYAARFVRSRSDVPNFGLTRSVYWLRFTVVNRGSVPREWLLELAYPHIDDVRLYIPLQGGRVEVRQAGDAWPFATRELAYRNFAFLLEEPPWKERTYYLRVASTGSLVVPLAAWTMRPFVEHQYFDWAALCVFYGIILVMAAYNGCVYVFTRQREYLYYVCSIISMGVFQFTIAGHTFQFLLPSQSWVANRMLPASMGLGLATGCHFARYYLACGDKHPRIDQFYGLYAGASWLLVVASFLLPYDIVLRFALGISLGGCAVVLCMNAWLAQGGARRAALYLVAWSSLLLGVMVSVLHSAGALPTTFLTSWSIQIGVALQLVLLSSALSDNINTIRAALAQQVSALQDALASAEEATQRAERATRVKDEFMATMSHEFRTPLNAIINIPQGLARQFPSRRFVSCACCDAKFELDEGEVVSEHTPCPECQSESLTPRVVVCYSGDPAQTADYLRKIERSGLHLLQVVNDILDFSKVEAGQLRLVLEQVSPASVVDEVIDEMEPLAQRAGVELRRASCASSEVTVDPLRVRQVLINLIGNAIKFTEGRGTVAVRVEESFDGHLFSVRDEGIGIAEDQLESVFASFNQVYTGNTRRYGGTGLGLSIARSLVRMHGGDLWAESQLGKGSTFFFRIPKSIHAASSRRSSQSLSERPSAAADAREAKVVGGHI